MPILNFEYTANLKIDQKIPDFLLEAHHILVAEIGTDLRTCRSCIIKREQYIIGDGDAKNAFILLAIQILPGRTEAQKDRVGKLLVNKIKQDFEAEISNHDVQVRVYVTETDKKHYYGLEKV